jgi:hypothetical protein
MSYRFKLLLVTALTCLGVVPQAIARVSLPSEFWSAGDRSPDALEIAPENFAAMLDQPIIQIVAASSGASSTSPASPAAPPTPASTASLEDWLWWGGIGLVPLGVVAGTLYLLRPKEQKQKSAKQSAKHKVEGHPSRSVSNSQWASENGDRVNAEADTEADTETGIETSQQKTANINLSRSIDPAPIPDRTNLAISATTRLSRVDIVELLLHDLHSPEPSQRRKAIWELGQRGDSRAMQPLVELLVDSDSTQRGLILAAATEISLRTLKPMNRALMLSMQDGSPEVRKNALRDITRVFELVTQNSQLLQYVTSDTDAEVRETAEWALGQLHCNRPSLGTPSGGTPSGGTSSGGTFSGISSGTEGRSRNPQPDLESK